MLDCGKSWGGGGGSPGHALDNCVLFEVEGISVQT
jgi:hypothetical protein